MNVTEVDQQVLTFEKARKNLLAVIAFSAINIILAAFNADMSFLFSATLPQLAFEIGKTLDAELESAFFTIVGLIGAGIIIISYVVFWALAKRNRVFLLVALISFGVDTLALVVLIVSMEFSFSVLLEIAFHIWVLYYLVTGVKAWLTLRNSNAASVHDIPEETKETHISNNG